MTTEVLDQAAETLTRRRAAIEDFWALPESMQHIEYISGEIVMAPTPTVSHQAALGNIYYVLRSFIRDKGLGQLFASPPDVVLPSGEVVQPDVFFLTEEETARAMSAKRVHGAPSFLVEILSPGSIKHDKITKRNLYEKNGVLEY